MRHFPIVAITLALSACVAAPPPVAPGPTPVASASAAPSAAPTAAPSAEVSAAPSAEPSASPTPTPTPTPTPSPSPTGSPGELGEANHGDDPFPSPPSGRALSLAFAKATAGAGQASAIGAIDDRIYTEWSARGGVGADTHLTIDLGSTQRFSKVDLLPDASPKVDCFFNVDVSDDGKTWRTVAAAKGTGSNEEPAWGTASFDPVRTRWVRIVPTSWGTSWVAVWEVRLRE